MKVPEVVELTRKLLAFNTINPPGNEAAIAGFTAGILEDHGFTVRLYPFEADRLHLVAEKGITTENGALVFSGHFDTVPLGAAPWIADPFSGEITGDKIFGRGSSDMKAGVAAMITAAVSETTTPAKGNGIRLIFTAGEELGCQGMQHLVSVIENPGRASAIIIGEPTANIPAVGHKGALYFRAVTKGKTAHSSMPSKGINAIYKAARGIVTIEQMTFNAREDKLLGFPTINVGKIQGGMNINSVPDHAEFTIDVRTTKGLDHTEIIGYLTGLLGPEIMLEKLVDLEAVSTDPDDPFIRMVYSLCDSEGISMPGPAALPYVTDGSVLQHLYPGTPLVILGPGQPEMAHQTDEFCYLSRIRQAEEIYRKIIRKKLVIC